MLTRPTTDYVRIWQDEGKENVGCDREYPLVALFRRQRLQKQVERAREARVGRPGRDADIPTSSTAPSHPTADYIKKHEEA